MAWLPLVDAAQAITVTAEGHVPPGDRDLADITPDQVAHWIGSGHVSVECWCSRGGRLEIRDDEAERLGHLWGMGIAKRKSRFGGKAYLSLYRGGQTLWSTTRVGDAFGISRDGVAKLDKRGCLEIVPVGYRGYVTEDSVRELLKRDPWRAKPSNPLYVLFAKTGVALPGPIVSDAVVEKLYGGS